MTKRKTTTTKTKKVPAANKGYELLDKQCAEELRQAAKWMSENRGVALKLTEMLADDNPDMLIVWMIADKQIADVVQRLALVTIHRAATDQLKAGNK